MEGIKDVNLIEIFPVVIEIRGVENGKLVVPINNTLVCHMAFLAADTGIYKTWIPDSGLVSGLDHALTVIQALIN